MINRRLRKNWMLVAAIWVVVVALTGWNLHLSAQIQSHRQELETLQMDMRFLQANSSGIEDALREKARLSHTVPSFSLGFVMVESDLKRLSWDMGLAALKVEADANAMGTIPAPLSVVATGSMPALVGWVTAVEEAYPYLSVRQMEIAYDQTKRLGQMRAIFSYHYTLPEQELTG